jgi:hypothetical protein
MAVAPSPPQSLADFYVPAYKVVLNGLPASEQLIHDIQSVTFHDSLTDVDSVDLVVNNWDPGEPANNQAVQGKFRYHNTHQFDPWQEIQVSMGYYRSGQDKLQEMLVGEISTMAPNFPASGGSTLTVRALSFLHQFRTTQKTQQFHGKDSEIARQIVKDINKDINENLKKKKIPNKINIQMDKKEVEDNINKETDQPYLEMHSQYPIVFLMQRAREIGYDITIDDKVDPKTKDRNITFHYRSSGSVLRPTYALVWGKSLISFQPTLQTARQVNAVTVKGWNVQTKKAISETQTRVDLAKEDHTVIAPEDLGLTENPLAQRLEIVVDRGFKNPDDARREALKTLRQIAQGLVEAKGKTIGLPDLRAGCKVNICMSPADLPWGKNRPPKPLDLFSGTYQVTETTHTISDSGYTTDFSCRREAQING